jgi:hypothetical protein
MLGRPDAVSLQYTCLPIWEVPEDFAIVIHSVADFALPVRKDLIICALSHNPPYNPPCK